MCLYRDIIINNYYLFRINLQYNKILKFTQLCIIITSNGFASSLFLPTQEQINDIDYNKIAAIKIYPSNINFGNFYNVSENHKNNTPNNKRGMIGNINLHKILGWSALSMVIITLGSGYIIPHDGHCMLSRITAGVTSFACIFGYYQYGKSISFSNGKWQNNMHAILGTIAPIGFIASCTTVGKKGSRLHAVIGGISGVTFTVSLVILYF